MAPPPKTYVDVSKPAVNDVFDDKYKSSLPAIMQKAADKAIKASPKLTGDKPKEKGAKGYMVAPSMVSLGPDKTGKQLAAECSMSIWTWPGKALKAMPSSKVHIGLDDPDKISASDVQDLAEAAADGAMKEAVKYMEKNPP